MQTGSQLIVVHLLLILELFLEEILIICGMGDGEDAFPTLFDFNIHEGLKGRADDQIDKVSLTELQWEFVIEREIYNLLVIDAQRYQLDLFVLAFNQNLVELVSRETHDSSRVRGLLVEICLLGGYLYT